MLCRICTLSSSLWRTGTTLSLFQRASPFKNQTAAVDGSTNRSTIHHLSFLFNFSTFGHHIARKKHKSIYHLLTLVISHSKFWLKSNPSHVQWSVFPSSCSNTFLICIKKHLQHWCLFTVSDDNKHCRTELWVLCILMALCHKLGNFSTLQTSTLSINHSVVLWRRHSNTHGQALPCN